MITLSLYQKEYVSKHLDKLPVERIANNIGVPTKILFNILNKENIQYERLSGRYNETLQQIGPRNWLAADVDGAYVYTEGLK